MNRQHIDTSMRNQWAIFRRGLPIKCRRCQLLFRATFLCSWLLAIVSPIAGPVLGYFYRGDWIGGLAGFTLGTCGTYLVNQIAYQLLFAHVQLCAAAPDKPTSATDQKTS